MKNRSRWILKRGPSHEATRREVSADAIYRAAGVAVPESHFMVDEYGTAWRASEIIAGTELGIWWQTAT